MKCPKCGYLGFETSDRCRNCGYDFSLSVRVDAPPELPLQSVTSSDGPLADFDLSNDRPRPAGSLNEIDLNRVIGASRPAAAPPVSTRTVQEPTVMGIEASRAGEDGLPLFGGEGEAADDTPLITTPRPVRAPLSVRRATPDVPRGRSRSPRVAARGIEGAPVLALEPARSEAADEAAPVAVAVEPSDLPAAGAIARVIAMLIDLVLLLAIDAAVLYFTLAIVGLGLDAISVLPRIPFIAFLALLNGGYLVAFTAAGGQTIGKMATGIRVVRDDRVRVDIADAVVRAFGCFTSLATAGLGYLPVLFSSDKRALHDRLAGTRVVRSR